MQLGMIGLGRMGANMVRRLIKDGHECVVFDTHPDAVGKLAKEGAVGTTTLDAFVHKLSPPRACWLMVPAAVVDDALEKLVPLLASGDIVIDGGNSYYVDDIRRAHELKSKGLHYVDVGTSGGVWGLERGYCMMIGGDEEAVKRLDPVFQTLAPPIDSARRRQAANRSRTAPTTAIFTAARMARGTSSRWSTTGSNTASWPRTPKDWPFSREPTSASASMRMTPRRRRCALLNCISTTSICATSPRSGGAAA